MKKSLIFVFTFLSFFMMSTSVYATAKYYVVDYDNTSIGKNARGTNAWSYVMANPSIAVHHISSVYVRANGDSTLYYAEAGWCVDGSIPGYSNYFIAYSNYGHVEEGHLFSIPRNSNHNFSVGNIPGTKNWNFDMDNTNYYIANVGFTTGWSTTSSERYASGDTNYSHFWAIAKESTSYTWSSWSNMTNLSDNDPNYYSLKVSNNEWYCTQ